ncbi:hypothetical protein KFU94_67545 [Chloroflexi bacterium TSY]|nr:hypothetical protein [Chloroflexi bacterium TSY]
MLSSDTLQASILLLKYIYDEALAERLSAILEPPANLPTEQILDHLLAMIKYLSSVTDRVSQGEVTNTISSVYQNTEEIMHTLADQWRQEREDIGYKRGIDEDEKKGREEGEAVVRRTILQILDSRFEILDQRFEPMYKFVADKLETCRLEELNDLVNYALEAFNLNAFVQRLPTDDLNEEVDNS